MKSWVVTQVPPTYKRKESLHIFFAFDLKWIYIFQEKSNIGLDLLKQPWYRSWYLSKLKQIRYYPLHLLDDPHVPKKDPYPLKRGNKLLCSTTIHAQNAMGYVEYISLFSLIYELF